MKQKKSRLALLAAAAVFLIFCLWYTAPRTAEQLFPEFSWENATDFVGTYDYYTAPDHPANAPTQHHGTTESIPMDSEEGQEILALLKDVKYRRSLWNLIPTNGTRYHAIQPGDISLSLWVNFDGPPHHFMVEFDHDDLRVSSVWTRYDCSAKGQDELAWQLYDLYQPYTMEGIVK